MTLKQYIKAGNTTIAKLASLLGVSEHAVRKWVYGQRTPDLKTAVAIEAFTKGQVSVAELLPTDAGDAA